MENMSVAAHPAFLSPRVGEPRILEIPALGGARTKGQRSRGHVGLAPVTGSVCVGRAVLGPKPDPSSRSSSLAGGLLAPPSGCYGPGLPPTAGGERVESVYVLGGGGPEGIDASLPLHSSLQKPSVFLWLC